MKKYGINKPSDLIYVLIGLMLFVCCLGFLGIGKDK